MPKPTRLTKMVRKMTSRGRVTHRVPFPARGPEIVTRRRMIEVGDPRSGFVDELGNPRILSNSIFETSSVFAW